MKYSNNVFSFNHICFFPLIFCPVFFLDLFSLSHFFLFLLLSFCIFKPFVLLFSLLFSSAFLSPPSSRFLLFPFLQIPLSCLARTLHVSRKWHRVCFVVVIRQTFFCTMLWCSCQAHTHAGYHKKWDFCAVTLETAGWFWIWSENLILFVVSTGDTGGEGDEKKGEFSFLL